MPCNTCKWKGRTDVCSPHKSMQAMMEGCCPAQRESHAPFFQRHPTIEIRFLNKANKRALRSYFSDLNKSFSQIQEQCLRRILENDL